MFSTCDEIPLTDSFSLSERRMRVTPSSRLNNIVQYDVSYSVTDCSLTNAANSPLKITVQLIGKWLHWSDKHIWRARITWRSSNKCTAKTYFYNNKLVIILYCFNLQSYHENYYCMQPQSI